MMQDHLHMPLARLREAATSATALDHVLGAVKKHLKHYVVSDSQRIGSQCGFGHLIDISTQARPPRAGRHQSTPIVHIALEAEAAQQLTRRLLLMPCPHSRPDLDQLRAHWLCLRPRIAMPPACHGVTSVNPQNQSLPASAHDQTRKMTLYPRTQAERAGSANRHNPIHHIYHLVPRWG